MRTSTDSLTPLQAAVHAAVVGTVDTDARLIGGSLDFSVDDVNDLIEELRASGFVLAPAATSDDGVRAAAQALAEDRHNPTGPFDLPQVLACDTERAQLALAAAQAAAPAIDLAALTAGLGDLQLHENTGDAFDEGYRAALQDVNGVVGAQVARTR